MKYIIKNCPSCHKDFRLNCQGQTYFNEYQCVYGIFDCKDVTDCLLKQIVKELDISSENFDRWCFAQGILNLLEIEEIEE